MLYQSFLIKYAEIGTKGKNRFLFEDALVSHICHALKRVDGKFDVTKDAGRIYVTALTEYDYEDVVEALKKVFGIAWICPMFQTEEREFEALKRQVVDYLDQVYPDKHLTFKVVARRADKRQAPAPQLRPPHLPQMTVAPPSGGVFLRGNFPPRALFALQRT